MIKQLAIASVILAFLTSGCSLVSKSRRALFGSDPGSSEDRKAEKAKKATPERPGGNNYVSKQEYDDLLKKYQDLSGLYRQKKDQASTNSILNDLNRGGRGSKSGLVETVDVFNEGGARATRSSELNVAIPNISTAPAFSEINPGDEAMVENEIAQLRKARDLLAKKNNDQAMSFLQSLERSKFNQIRVRAKFLIGSLLLSQAEFDLAMQVFEEIIQKYAFSHLVINALEGLVVCAEKLNIPQKRDKYYSMLHDVFGRS